MSIAVIGTYIHPKKRKEWYLKRSSSIICRKQNLRFFLSIHKLNVKEKYSANYIILNLDWMTNQLEARITIIYNCYRL